MHFLRFLVLLLVVIVPCSFAAITPDTEKSEAAFFIRQLENSDADLTRTHLLFFRVWARGENVRLMGYNLRRFC